MANIYLHVGTSKTGTTAIQAFLTDNRSILEEKNMVFPNFEVKYPNIIEKRNAYFMTWYHKGCKKTTEDTRLYHSYLQKIEGIVKEGKDVILSDEGIWKFISPEDSFFTEIKSDLEKIPANLKVIVYLRRQDLWMQSHWAQMVKEGNTKTFKEYIDQYMAIIEYRLDYGRVLRYLASIIGKENIIVRVYEKSKYKGKQGNIHSDFLDIFDMELTEEYYVEKSRFNVSLEGDYLEMKRILNHFSEFKSNQHPLIKTIKKIQDKKWYPDNYKKVTYFAKGEQERFLKSFHLSNEIVAREYLNREDGILFDDPIEDLPSYHIDSENMIRDLILAYGEMFHNVEYGENNQLHKQIRKIEKQKKEIDELRQMIRQLQRDSLWYRLKRKIKCSIGKGDEYI